MAQISLRKEKINLSYDKNADVLYLSFGTPSNCDIYPITDSDLVRTKPDTNEIIGITIIGFSERYHISPPKRINKKLSSVINLLVDKFNHEYQY